MQRALQTPLDALQLPPLPHFVDAAASADTAGVSLTCASVFSNNETAKANFFLGGSESKHFN
jgi:hypothetical protein